MPIGRRRGDRGWDGRGPMEGKLLVVLALLDSSTNNASHLAARANHGAAGRGTDREGSGWEWSEKGSGANESELGFGS